MLRRFTIAALISLAPGFAEASEPSDFRVRDRDGRTSATLERRSSGDWRIEDRSGRSLGTARQDSTGRLILRDRAGRRVGTVEPRGR